MQGSSSTVWHTSAGGPHEPLTAGNGVSLRTRLARACSRRSGDLPAAADNRPSPFTTRCREAIAAALFQDAASASLAFAAHLMIGLTSAIRLVPALLGLSGLRDVRADI